MTEVIVLVLAGVILIQMGMMVWYIRYTSGTLKMYVRAIIAKNLQEVTAAEIEDKKGEDDKKDEVKPLEYVPISTLSDEEFNKVVAKNLKRQDKK